MATNAFSDLGCCAILQEILPINAEEVFRRHGFWWDDEKIKRVLILDYGCIEKHGQPSPGDIVISGMHPGIVLPGGKVVQILRGRRLVTDLWNWSIKAVLACPQR